MDWQMLIKTLRNQGMTLIEIAAACDAPTSTVSDIARGATRAPGADLGMRLLELLPKQRRKPKPKRKRTTA